VELNILCCSQVGALRAHTCARLRGLSAGPPGLPLPPHTDPRIDSRVSATSADHRPTAPPADHRPTAPPADHSASRARGFGARFAEDCLRVMHTEGCLRAVHREHPASDAQRAVCEEASLTAAIVHDYAFAAPVPSLSTSQSDILGECACRAAFASTHTRGAFVCRRARRAGGATRGLRRGAGASFPRCGIPVSGWEGKACSEGQLLTRQLPPLLVGEALQRARAFRARTRLRHTLSPPQS
jgi:hypothetical protein